MKADFSNAKSNWRPISVTPSPTGGRFQQRHLKGARLKGRRKIAAPQLIDGVMDMHA